jgi:hypothetical protein
MEPIMSKLPTNELGYRIALKAAMFVFKVIYFGLVFPVRFAKNYANELSKRKTKTVPPA